MSGPPWTRRSTCWSPASPSTPAATRPATGSFQIPLTTSRPCHSCARPRLTFTDTTRPSSSAPTPRTLRGADPARRDDEQEPERQQGADDDELPAERAAGERERAARRRPAVGPAPRPRTAWHHLSSAAADRRRWIADGERGVDHLADPDHRTAAHGRRVAGRDLRCGRCAAKAFVSRTEPRGGHSVSTSRDCSHRRFSPMSSSGNGTLPAAAEHARPPAVAGAGRKTAPSDP